MEETAFKRGDVYKIMFKPFDTSRKEDKIPKYVLNLQEGRVVEKRDRFVCLLFTTNEEVLKNPYPWDVKISPEESHTEKGAIVSCGEVYTVLKEDIIKQDDIIKPVYVLSKETIRRIDHRLYYGLCFGGTKIEDVETSFLNI